MVAPEARRSLRIGGAIGGSTTAITLVLSWALPALTAAEGGADATAGPAPLTEPWWLVAGLLVLQGVALAAAMPRPRLALAATAVLAAVVGIAVPTAAHGLADLAVAVASAVAGLRVALSRLWPSALVAGVLVVVGDAASALLTTSASAPAEVVGTALLQAVVVVGIPLSGAIAVRSRREVRRARLAETSAALREQDARIAAAVAREREGMARELHDIAAHHLSGMALRLGVVDRQIDRDPASAHEGVREVREQSRAVLDDLRRLVGLLREDGAADRTVETLAGIPGLVERAGRDAEVELRVLGADREGGLAAGIGPLAQLAGYRTIQEALTNVVTHAPGAACEVVVDAREDDRVTLRVTNVASAVAPVGPAGGGYGLRGMRERADLVGARLRYGPIDGGGWEVELTLDRDRGGS